MKSISKKNKIILIPDKLKECRTKVKFSYIALKNLLYYIDKGTRTQTKHTKDSHMQVMNAMLEGYFNVIEQNNSLTNDEAKILKSCFTEKNQSMIFKNDYALAVEKELTFKKFAFYCNCLVELSFHVGEDYFDDKYISETIVELSNKMLAEVNDVFIEFIILDVHNIIELIENI